MTSANGALALTRISSGWNRCCSIVGAISAPFGVAPSANRSFELKSVALQVAECGEALAQRGELGKRVGGRQGEARRTEAERLPFGPTSCRQHLGELPEHVRSGKGLGQDEADA